MDNKSKKEVKKASKRHPNEKTLLLGRRVNQGFNITLAEGVDRTENISDFMNESIEILNAGIEGSIRLKFAGNEVKLPIRRRPIGEDDQGNTKFEYHAFFEESGLKMEIDLSHVKTNIGIKSDQEKLDVTRTEVFYKRKMDSDHPKNKLPAELSLKEVYKENENFGKIALLSKRRCFIQNLINKLEEIIKTTNAIKYQAKSLKRSPEQIMNLEQLSFLKKQRDDSVVKIREVEADIQKESTDVQKFMHAALKVLSAEELGKINEQLK